MHFKPDPMGDPRNPFHVFLLVVLVINGMSIATGPVTSVAIEAMNDLGVRAFGLLLLAGAGCVLVGMYWPGDRRTGLLVKKVGYLGLGASTFVYGCAVLYTTHNPGGYLAASVAVALAGICFWTVRRINKRVNKHIAYREGF